MDIRIRAESLRPVRYLRSHRQRDREASLAARQWPESPDGDLAAADAMWWRQAARVAGTTDGCRIAIIGMGCRFPDADDPVGLLDVVLTGRRAFRRLPPGRLELADYYSADRSAPDATYSARAALIEGWQFDRAAFGVPDGVYRVVDPAQWLALETAARALAAAGFVAGEGLARSRTGVVIGNSLNGDWSRASAMRLRWPYVRRIFADALAAGGIPAQYALPVLGYAKQRYLDPFPATTDETLSGSMPAAIAARICGYFGFRGGGYAVDGSQASSLLAVASACSALASGDLDVAVAGGVDLGLDPLELVGLAKTGVLARGDMRVYDENPTGYLPGEGCGMVVLMRSPDARAAGLPVYAEIAGWGTSSGQAAAAVPDSRSQFLALHRAYQRAGIAPGDVQLIEGHGAGTATSDTTELSALAELRSDARQVAALGSVKANIGNTKAAAGVASLIKTVLAMSTGLIPPATGFSRPHPLVRGGEAALRLPRAPQPWPDGPRIAGVSAMGPGIDVHLVLHSEPTRGRHERKLRAVPPAPRATAGAGAGPAEVPVPLIGGPTRSAAYLLHAPDREALAAQLGRIARVASWLSDSELGDLACQLAGDAASQGPVRVALVASSQDHLARLASQAAALLPRLPDGLLTLRPGIYAADGADGRVTLMFSDAAGAADRAGAPAQAPPGDLLWPLSVLRWLDDLGVSATATVGCGRGEMAGLIWAGCLAETDAAAFAADRAKILNAALIPDSPAQPGSDAGEQAGPVSGRTQQPPAVHSSVLREAARRLKVATPRRRLISAGLGHEVRSADDILQVLSADAVSPAGLEAALRAGAVGATLLLETGPGHVLAKAATAACRVPAVSLGAGSGADAAHTAAALFAAGALEHPGEVFAGRPSRPFDLWREQTFISSPAQTRPAIRAPQRAAVGAARRAPAQPPAGASETSPAPEPAPAPQPSAGASPAAGPVPAQRRGAEPASRAPAAPGSAGPVSESGPVPQAMPGTAAPPRATPPPRRARSAARHAAPQAPEQDQAAPVAPRPAEQPWARCYAEELRPADDVVTPGDDRPWRVRAATAKSFGLLVRKLFRDDPAAGRALAICGDSSDLDSALVALTAALDAIASGTLVLVTHGPGFSGFCASLHAEHPELGITLLRVPSSAEGLRLARKFAAAEPGRFREFVIGPADEPRVAVMAPVPVPGSGEFPLGPDDVVVVTRSGTGAELALAQVLGCCGAAIGIVGRSQPGEPPQVSAELEKLVSAGVRITSQEADLDSQDGLTAALRDIEGQFGPVTALAHAASPAGPRLVAELTEDDLRARLSAESARIARLAAAIGAAAPSRLRLVLTFGSVAGRYGLAGGGLQALAGAALAESAGRVASGIEGCRALHIDWPGWAGPEPGPQDTAAGEFSGSGATPIGMEQGSRLLLKALATPGLPERVAIHGRVGVPEPPAVAAAGCTQPGGRFLEYVRVDYPEVELVCDARLSLRTDPYLADHRVYGMPVLPAAIALEAMAQAAAAVAGRPLRQLTAVSMDAPVVVPAHDQNAHALIRISAVADGSCVKAVLRCAESGFATDHFRATFRSADDPPAAVAPALTGMPELDEMPASDSGIVDGTELYGPVCFQTGRFRRAALLPEVTSRSCRALVRGEDSQSWFGEDAAEASASLVLGNPGLNDATWHVLQACVPHRRLLPSGCESVVFSGREADGAVEIRAVQTALTATAAGGTEYIWDAEAIDAAGQPLVTWRGLRLADTGPLARDAAWPPSLLSVYLERSAVALGLHPELRVAVHAGQPGSPGAAPAAAAPVPAPSAPAPSVPPPPVPPASVPAPSPPPDAQLAPSPLPPGARTPSPLPEHAARGSGGLSGFTLSVRAPGSAACGWEPVEPGPDPGPEPSLKASPDLAGLEAELCTRGEQPATAKARLRAVTACLAGLGPLARPPVIAGSAEESDWLVLRAGAATLASAIVEMSGVSCPVAVAIMTSDQTAVPAPATELDQKAEQDQAAELDQTAELGRAADLAGTRGGGGA